MADPCTICGAGSVREITVKRKHRTRNVLHEGERDEYHLGAKFSTHESLCSGTVDRAQIPRSGNEVRSL
jgi:hypothetical protein